MGKKSNMSRDQKRKAKLAKRAERSPERFSLAYTGNKYKTDELTPAVFETELGIYQAYVMSDKNLTDRAVASALEKLVLQMREGPLPSLESTDAVKLVEGKEADFIITCIRRNWQTFFQEAPHPGRDNLIGILRTLLNSLRVWGSPGAGSLGYLSFLEGFMKRAGVSTDTFDRKTDHPVYDGDEDEDSFLHLGKEWVLDDNEESGSEFCHYAERLIEEGDGDRVVNVSQQLIGLSLGDSASLSQLTQLSLKAQLAMVKNRGSQTLGN